MFARRSVIRSFRFLQHSIKRAIGAGMFHIQFVVLVRLTVHTDPVLGMKNVLKSAYGSPLK